MEILKSLADLASTNPSAALIVVVGILGLVMLVSAGIAYKFFGWDLKRQQKDETRDKDDTQREKDTNQILLKLVGITDTAQRQYIQLMQSLADLTIALRETNANTAAANATEIERVKMREQALVTQAKNDELHTQQLAAQTSAIQTLTGTMATTIQDTAGKTTQVISEAFKTELAAVKTSVTETLQQEIMPMNGQLAKIVNEIGEIRSHLFNVDAELKDLDAKLLSVLAQIQNRTDPPTLPQDPPAPVADDPLPLSPKA